MTVQAGGYYAMTVEGYSLTRGSARTPVSVHRAVRYRTTKDEHPQLVGGRQPAQWVRFKTRAWSFTTV